MKNTIKRFSVSLASSALLLNMVSPALAGTTIITDGNGSDTTNHSVVNVTQTKMVTQSNDTEISNDFDVDANTGDNEAEDNTGGNVSIETGDTNVIVDVENIANKNAANLSACGTCAGDASVLISNNGDDSDNTVVLNQTTSVWAIQDNHANVENEVDIDAQTGDNDAEDNTGGESSIKTGNVLALVDVENDLNFNSANVACDDCLMDVSAKVADNGTESDNMIAATLDGGVFVTQDNSCGGFGQVSFLRHWPFHHGCLENDIEIEAETGDNEVENSTNGTDSDPMIDTGNSGVKIDVANAGGVNVYGASVPPITVNFSMGSMFATMWAMWH